MGADEYDYRETDFNNDGVVNFIDYAMLAGAWQTNPNDVNDYNDIFDLQDNNSIDYKDLALFCEDWLWVASWTEIEGLMMMMDQGIGLEKSVCSALISKQYDQSEQKQLEEVEPVDIKLLLDWLDKLWLSGELEKTMTEKEYLEFRKAIENAGF